MTFRHGVLTVAALAVLGLGVYLFIEVRAPAPATVTPPERVAAADEAPAEPDDAEADPTTRRSSRLPNGIRRVKTAVPPRDSTGPAPAAPAVPPEDLQKIDAVMAEANKAYDRGDFDEARQIAMRVLGGDPTNVRMLRIVVSAACIDGDSADAQKHYLLLPARDRQQMKTRCDRYGISFTDS